MTLSLVPLLGVIQREIHVAFWLGRVSSTLDASLVAYGAYWKERGRTREEVRALVIELLKGAGQLPRAARSGGEVGAQDVAADMLNAAVRAYTRDVEVTPGEGWRIAM